MDDRRFDSLVKALAEGTNRRSVLKGILGLGGAALAGGTLLEGETDAARRPSPTPTPIKCPGKQVPVGGVCTCPGTAPNKCGPDCCTGKTTDPYPRAATHSECCDNACCFGTCYGEELCCPTNSPAGGGSPTHKICDTPDGPICIEGTCCNDSECGNGDPCLKCDEETHVCVERCPGDNEVCCTGQAGPGVCVTGECCPGLPCTLPSDDDDEDSGVCCDGQCLSSDQVCNGGECCPGGFCDGNGDCCAPPSVGCNGGTCCDGFCDVNGDCCPAPNVGCNGGVCCDVACDQQGNCPSTPTCEPNCLCGDGVVDPATDGLECNGGLDAGGGVCACGYCVVPLDGCPCGCEGDPECVECAGGQCVLINQGESCNGGDGICDDVYCVDAPPVDCEALCAIGDRCGSVDGCECVCSEGLFCMPNSTFCCPGTGLGTDDNCAYCGDACEVGSSCQGGVCTPNTVCTGDGDCASNNCCSGTCLAAGECCVADDCLTIAAGLCVGVGGVLNLCICTEAHVCLPLIG